MRDEGLWGQAGVLVDTVYLPLLPKLHKYIPPGSQHTPLLTPLVHCGLTAPRWLPDGCLVPWWLPGETRDRPALVQQRAAFLR